MKRGGKMRKINYQEMTLHIQLVTDSELFIVIDPSILRDRL